MFTLCQHPGFMVLSVVCTLADDVLSPVAKFTLKILENSDLCQQLVDVGIRVIPGVPIGERTATSKGNHVWQLKRRLPRPTLTCRSPCVAASPPRRATWAAPRSGSTDGCSRGFRRLHRRAMGSVGSDRWHRTRPDRVGRPRPRAAEAAPATIFDKVKAHPVKVSGVLA